MSSVCLTTSAPANPLPRWLAVMAAPEMQRLLAEFIAKALFMRLSCCRSERFVKCLSRPGGQAERDENWKRNEIKYHKSLN